MDTNVLYLRNRPEGWHWINIVFILDVSTSRLYVFIQVLVITARIGKDKIFTKSIWILIICLPNTWTNQISLGCTINVLS